MFISVMTMLNFRNMVPHVNFEDIMDLLFYTVFHKIGTPLYFFNNFQMLIDLNKNTPMYTLGNLLSEDVVCIPFHPSSSWASCM